MNGSTKQRTNEVLIKHVSLSSRSLQRAFAWATANEFTSPIADAYLAACAAVGSLEFDRVVSELEKHRYKSMGEWIRLGKLYAKLNALRNLSFVYRDELGREILHIISVESNPPG
jgi:hypothetical protein